MSRTPYDRAREMLAEHDITGRTEPLQWRMSPDVQAELLPVVYAGGVSIGRAISLSFPDRDMRYGDRLLGLPVVVQGTLPPNSLILENPKSAGKE